MGEIDSFYPYSINNDGIAFHFLITLIHPKFSILKLMIGSFYACILNIAWVLNKEE